MNSPKKQGNQILGALSVDEAQAFLMDCANLPDPIGKPDNRASFHRWLRKWHKFFTFRTEDKDGTWRSLKVPQQQLEYFIPRLQTALWRIWIEQDMRQRDWYFYRLRDAYHRMIVRLENPHVFDPTAKNAADHLLRLEKISRHRRDNPEQRIRFFEREMGYDEFGDVPKICPFEAAVYWLQSNQRFMLRCGGPMCAAPYFFRQEKGQRYCSPECADPARRESKRRWWHEQQRKEAKG